MEIKRRYIVLSLSFLIITIITATILLYDDFPYSEQSYKFSADVYIVQSLDTTGKGEFSIRYQIKDGNLTSKWHYEKIGKGSGGILIHYDFVKPVYLGDSQTIYLQLVEQDFTEYTPYLIVSMSDIGSHGNITQYERYENGEPQGGFMTISWSQ